MSRGGTTRSGEGERGGEGDGTPGDMCEGARVNLAVERARVMSVARLKTRCDLGVCGGVGRRAENVDAGEEDREEGAGRRSGAKGVGWRGEWVLLRVGPVGVRGVRGLVLVAAVRMETSAARGVALKTKPDDMAGQRLMGVGGRGRMGGVGSVVSDQVIG